MLEIAIPLFLIFILKNFFTPFMDITAKASLLLLLASVYLVMLSLSILVFTLVYNGVILEIVKIISRCKLGVGDRPAKNKGVMGASIDGSANGGRRSWLIAGSILSKATKYVTSFILAALPIHLIVAAMTRLSHCRVSPYLDPNNASARWQELTTTVLRIKYQLHWVAKAARTYIPIMDLMVVDALSILQLAPQMVLGAIPKIKAHGIDISSKIAQAIALLSHPLAFRFTNQGPFSILHKKLKASVRSITDFTDTAKAVFLLACSFISVQFFELLLKVRRACMEPNVVASARETLACIRLCAVAKFLDCISVLFRDMSDTPGAVFLLACSFISVQFFELLPKVNEACASAPETQTWIHLCAFAKCLDFIFVSFLDVSRMVLLQLLLYLLHDLSSLRNCIASGSRLSALSVKRLGYTLLRLRRISRKDWIQPLKNVCCSIMDALILLSFSRASAVIEVSANTAYIQTWDQLSSSKCLFPTLSLDSGSNDTTIPFAASESDSGQSYQVDISAHYDCDETTDLDDSNGGKGTILGSAVDLELQTTVCNADKLSSFEYGDLQLLFDKFADVGIRDNPLVISGQSSVDVSAHHDRDEMADSEDGDHDEDTVLGSAINLEQCLDCGDIQSLSDESADVDISNTPAMVPVGTLEPISNVCSTWCWDCVGSANVHLFHQDFRRELPLSKPTVWDDEDDWLLGLLFYDTADVELIESYFDMDLAILELCRIDVIVKPDSLSEGAFKRLFCEVQISEPKRTLQTLFEKPKTPALIKFWNDLYAAVDFDDEPSVSVAEGVVDCTNELPRSFGDDLFTLVPLVTDNAYHDTVSLSALDALPSLAIADNALQSDSANVCATLPDTPTVAAISSVSETQGQGLSTHASAQHNVNPPSDTFLEDDLLDAFWEDGVDESAFAETESGPYDGFEYEWAPTLDYSDTLDERSLADLCGSSKTDEVESTINSTEDPTCLRSSHSKIDDSEGVQENIPSSNADEDSISDHEANCLDITGNIGDTLQDSKEIDEQSSSVTVSDTDPEGPLCIPAAGEEKHLLSATESDNNRASEAQPLAIVSELSRPPATTLDMLPLSPIVFSPRLQGTLSSPRKFARSLSPQGLKRKSIFQRSRFLLSTKTLPEPLLPSPQPDVDPTPMANVADDVSSAPTIQVVPPSPVATSTPTLTIITQETTTQLADTLQALSSSEASTSPPTLPLPNVSKGPTQSDVSISTTPRPGMDAVMANDQDANPQVSSGEVKVPSAASIQATVQDVQVSSGEVKVPSAASTQATIQDVEMTAAYLDVPSLKIDFSDLFHIGTNFRSYPDLSSPQFDPVRQFLNAVDSMDTNPDEILSLQDADMGDYEREKHMKTAIRERKYIEALVRQGHVVLGTALALASHHRDALKLAARLRKIVDPKLKTRVEVARNRKDVPLNRGRRTYTPYGRFSALARAGYNEMW